MNNTLQTLASFFNFQIIFKKEENGDDSLGNINYEMYKKGNEEPFAVCELDYTHQLKSFYLTDTTEPGQLTSTDMCPIAEMFISAFYPGALNTYMLQAIIDMDESYIITYGIKDEKYDIDLPNVGFSLTITTSGQVEQFTYEHEPIEIIYPSKMISAEEAKEKYVSRISFEQVIKQTDSEIYGNGDDSFRIVYAICKAAVDIPASGADPVIVEEVSSYESIKHLTPPSSTIYELVGITAHHNKLGEYVSEGVTIEKWIDQSVTAPECVDYTEAYSSKMITIHYDQTGLPTFIFNGEHRKGDVALTTAQLKQHALKFLFKLYPDAHHHFFIELEEVDSEDSVDDDAYDVLHDGNAQDENVDDRAEYDDGLDHEIEEDEEESVAFYFPYHIHGVLVDEMVTCIQVGLYSGNIVSADIKHMTEDVIANIQLEPLLSVATAKKKYVDQLQMELTIVQEYDEDGKPYYTFSYLPAFPDTTGHVQMIDAINGQAYYVDIGDTHFCD